MARAAVQGMAPSVVYSPNVPAGMSANPAGSEMKVRITGMTRPISTAAGPWRSNQAVARSMSGPGRPPRRPQRLIAWVLGGARFLMGFGVGLDLPVAMAFLAEFSRVSGKGNKASAVAAWCPAWYAATSTCYLLILGLYAVLPESHTGWLWRLTLAFGAVPALAIIAVRSRYISESPIWAANQGDLEGAARILKRTYGIDA